MKSAAPAPDLAGATLAELRIALAPGIARAAVFDGWSRAAVEAAARMRAVRPEVAALAFPGGAMDMIAAWIATVDAAMEQAFAGGTLTGLPIRERISRLIRFRLDAIAGCEEALRRALTIMAMPQNAATSLRLGWANMASVAACAFAMLALWQGQQLMQRQAQLQGQLRQAQLAKPMAAPIDSTAEAARQVAAFYAYLPRHEMIPDQLKQLVAIAGKSGVLLAKADYKAQPEESADFLRYQITLPIKADHARVQAFILAALHRLPTLTLDSVTFKRNAPDAAEVEARVQFVLLVRKAASKEARS